MCVRVYCRLHIHITLAIVNCIFRVTKMNEKIKQNKIKEKKRRNSLTRVSWRSHNVSRRKIFFFKIALHNSLNQPRETCLYYCFLFFILLSKNYQWAYYVHHVYIALPHYMTCKKATTINSLPDEWKTIKNEEERLHITQW